MKTLLIMLKDGLILDIRKRLMYKFWYNYIKQKYAS